MMASLAVFDAAFYLLIAVALVWKHRRTKDAGFLWLGLPLVLFPLAALPLTFWLDAAADRLALGQRVGCYPFTLVEQGRVTLGELLTRMNLAEHAVWGVSALIAVLVLCRQKADRASQG
ncbi:MAG: hypothetical protein V1873_01095 [Verrucomicrobiota bacterium]